MEVSRRGFILSTTAAATLAGRGAAAPAAAGRVIAQAGAPSLRGVDPSDPTFKFDLVIANGDVLDPGQGLRGRRDIGIKHGQIALVAPSIPADRAIQRYDTAGRLVTPGLIDLHTHYGPLVSGIGLPSDELVPISATTTAVSANTSPPEMWSAWSWP